MGEYNLERFTCRMTFFDLIFFPLESLLSGVNHSEKKLAEK